MIFKIAYKKDNNMLVKIAGLDPVEEKKDKKDGTWAGCSANVYNWAKKTYKEGDEVKVEYSVNNGQYVVTRITKGAGESVQNEVKKASASTCKDCGKELKDNKYEKCYTCNQKNPSKSPSKSGSPDYKNGAPYGSLLPVEETRRNKLATMSSACGAIHVMTGQVDNADTVADMIIVIYDKLYKKMFG